MQSLDEELVTVAEAASLLGVAQSTMRRWIREGAVPAYRVGQRRLGLRRSDLRGLVVPAEPNGGSGGHEPPPSTRLNLRLTPAQQRQALAAVEAAKRLQQEMLQRSNGQLFSPSWELLDQARDERDRQLT